MFLPDGSSSMVSLTSDGHERLSATVCAISECVCFVRRTFLCSPPSGTLSRGSCSALDDVLIDRWVCRRRSWLTTTSLRFDLESTLSPWALSPPETRPGPLPAGDIDTSPPPPLLTAPALLRSLWDACLEESVPWREDRLLVRRMFRMLGYSTKLSTLMLCGLLRRGSAPDSVLLFNPTRDRYSGGASEQLISTVATFPAAGREYGGGGGGRFVPPPDSRVVRWVADDSPGGLRLGWMV